MRKTLLGATVILPALSAGATLAADLPPLKDPTAPYLAASPVWTGFYAGLSAGYDFGGSNSATVTTWPDFINPAFAPGVIAGGSILQGTASGVLTLNNSGFVGGGQAGYNYQFSNNLVVGVETDIQGATGRGSANAAKALPAPAEFGFAVASTMTATKKSRLSGHGPRSDRVARLVKLTRLRHRRSRLRRLKLKRQYLYECLPCSCALDSLNQQLV